MWICSENWEIMTAIYVYNDDGGGKTRIFSCPEEYQRFREELNDQYKKMCDAALYSALRPVELRRLWKHPEWFDKTRRLLNLPKGSINKKKAPQWRSVMLTLEGAIAIERFLALELEERPLIVKTRTGTRKVMLVGPTDSAWHQALTGAAERAGIDGGTVGVCPKMFRKTWLSWLVSAFEGKIARIAKSMGHSMKTLVDHYLGVGFTKAEQESIERKVSGWGEGA
jgi:integrase